MNIQIYGTNKSFDTKKAERWFSERRIKFQRIDMKRDGLSGREFDSVLRAVGGAAVFFALNTLLKLPFPKDFLNSASYASLIVRGLRYAVTAFVLFGIYPMAFRLTDKWFGKKEGTTVQA